MKSIMSYIRSSQKSLDIDDETIDRDLIHVICNKIDLVPIASQIARTFPLYCAKTADTTHRNFKLRFTSVDDNDECDKAGLIDLMDNVRNAAKIGDIDISKKSKKLPFSSFFSHFFEIFVRLATLCTPLDF